MIHEKTGFLLLNNHGDIIQHINIPSNYSAHTVHPNSVNSILIGSMQGELSLNLIHDNICKVVQLGKHFECPIVSLKFSLDGEYLCVVSEKCEVKVFNGIDFTFIKAFKTNGTVSKIITTRMDIHESKKYAFLTITYDASGKNSILNMITIEKKEASLRVFEIEGHMTEICALDRQPDDDLLTLFAIGEKKIQKFKIGEVDVKKLTSRDTIEITNEKGILKMYSFFNLMLTYSSDGKIAVRNLLDKKKGVKELRAHDALSSGVVSIHLLDFGRAFVSIGGDGVFKFWKINTVHVHRPSLVAFIDRKESVSVIDEVMKRHLALVNLILISLMVGKR